ncbi:MAG: thermonuclease family protein [Candidatus Woesearchaeota archaeon]|nr:MAG: thermonuclease family protein [Candidatus Woesearchaeota archaeon]
MRRALVGIIILIFLFSGCIREEVFVYEVIDGDTFLISTGDRIRLIGIDAPEKDQPYYLEAKERLSGLLKNKKVTLEKDKEDMDSYGRLLRYVYADDVFVTLELIEEGYARVIIIHPNSKYESELKKAEYKAKESELGIWFKYSS